MPEAQIADAAVKERFKVEGRQLYNPPVNLHHNPFPPMEKRWMISRGCLYPLTEQQLADVHAMFEEGDERRARTLNVEEVQRSIALCRRTGVRVPQWMHMALRLLQEQRDAKYPVRASSPEI